VRAEDLAFPDSPVDGVHAGSSDGDAYPTWACMRFLGVHELQDFGAAELGEDDLLHGVVLNAHGGGCGRA
jgi:hypothetical protein